MCSLIRERSGGAEIPGACIGVDRPAAAGSAALEPAGPGVRLGVAVVRVVDLDVVRLARVLGVRPGPRVRRGGADDLRLAETGARHHDPHGVRRVVDQVRDSAADALAVTASHRRTTAPVTRTCLEVHLAEELPCGLQAQVVAVVLTHAVEGPEGAGHDYVAGTVPEGGAYDVTLADVGLVDVTAGGVDPPL